MPEISERERLENEEFWSADAQAARHGIEPGSTPSRRAIITLVTAVAVAAILAIWLAAGRPGL